jgi:steroid delta-isomerase-like uncharacterized protein
MATQDLAGMIRQMYEAWNAKDLDRCASFAHPDAQMTNVPFGEQLGFRQYVANWARAFPDGKLEIRRVVAQGDDAFVEMTGRGTHTGTLTGPAGDLPATQRRVELGCVECFRFRDGRIAEGRIYFDAFSLFKQLGVGAAPTRSTTAATSPRT